MSEAPPAAELAAIMPDMTDVIAEIVSDVAEAIEGAMGNRRAIKTQGGPYEASLLITYEKRLQEAAAAALTTVINHPRLRPPSA